MPLGDLNESDWAYLKDALGVGGGKSSRRRYVGPHELRGKPSQLGNESLPLFRYGEVVVQARRFTCPYCNAAVTMSQLAHARRWGWCPHCADGVSLPPHLTHLLDWSRSDLRHALFRDLRLRPAFEFDRSSGWRVYTIALCLKAKGGRK